MLSVYIDIIILCLVIQDVSFNLDTLLLIHEIAVFKPDVQCAKRNADYMQARVYYESIERQHNSQKIL